jgi:hypothetical protein
MHGGGQACANAPALSAWSGIRVGSILLINEPNSSVRKVLPGYRTLHTLEETLKRASA